MVPAAASIVLAGLTAHAAEPGSDLFEKKIRPLLVEHCYKCHSAESDKIKGQLRLDSRQAILKGGESGPAVLPGDPERSLLIKAVRYTDKDLQMPPKDKKLSDRQIADLTAWVKIGVPWGEDNAVPSRPNREPFKVTEQDRHPWA